MSDQPSSVPDSDSAVESPADPAIAPPGKGWFQRLTSVLFIIFCFELGLFLLVYPWTDGWSDNYFAWAIRGSVQTAWHSFWNNSFVRGGISGVGAINLWIAVTEVFRVFSRGKS